MLPAEKQTLLSSLTEAERQLIKECVDADASGQHLPTLRRATIDKFEKLGLLSGVRHKPVEGGQSEYLPFVTDKARELFA